MESRKLAVKETTAIIMPPGLYFVGDPCYAVPNDKWMPWLEAADYENERRFLVAEIDGKSVLGIGTAHGDGQFTDTEGNVYPVDAGLIGLVPVEVGEKQNGNRQVEFVAQVRCTYEDGVISFGDIEINTDPDEDDYMWGDDDDDDLDCEDEGCEDDVGPPDPGEGGDLDNPEVGMEC